MTKYETELKALRLRVEDTLRKIGSFKLELKEDEDPDFYSELEVWAYIDTGRKIENVLLIGIENTESGLMVLYRDRDYEVGTKEVRFITLDELVALYAAWVDWVSHKLGIDFEICNDEVVEVSPRSLYADLYISDELSPKNIKEFEEKLSEFNKFHGTRLETERYWKNYDNDCYYSRVYLEVI